MPLRPRPSCNSCKSGTSVLWRKTSDGQVSCNSCTLKNESSNGNGKEPCNANGNGNGNQEKNANNIVPSQYVGPTRKSARIKPSKYKYQAIAKPLATKGKNRRVIFKKNPIKAPGSVATVVSTDYVFHDSQYWQVGDVVSVMDHDGGIYYAQIRGFLQDQFTQKSIVITWLIPTTSSPPEGFDPATFILGPEEDLPRNMDAFEFVMHAPSEYFKAQNSPYPCLPTQPELGYVHTSLGPQIRRIPPKDEIYGLRELDSSEKTTPPPEKVKTKKDGEGKGKRKKEAKEKDKKEKKEPKEQKEKPDRGFRERAKDRLSKDSNK